MSQPALSRQIQALERELGVALFERRSGSRHMALTPAGEILLQRARILRSEIEQTTLLIEEVKREAREVVRVAAASAPMRYVVIPAVSELQHWRPGARVELVETDFGSELSLVERREVDLAIGGLPTDRRELGWEDLYVARFYALVSLQHPWADCPTISVEELAQEELLLLKNGPSAQLMYEFLFHLNGLAPKSYFESHVPETLLAAAEANLGVALLTDTTPFHSYKVRAIPVLYKGQQIMIPRVVAWHRRRSLSDVGRRFVEILKEQSAPRAV
jgi:DNA-binding transcriptional LysR family regulator